MGKKVTTETVTNKRTHCSSDKERVLFDVADYHRAVRAGGTSGDDAFHSPSMSQTALSAQGSHTVPITPMSLQIS